MRKMTRSNQHNKSIHTPVDVLQAIDLKYNHHLSYAQIAAIQGVTPQAIHQKIKDLLPIPETQVYIDHRSEILAHTQLRLLAELDAARLKEMGGRDLVVSMGILYDKERVERGLAGDDKRPLLVVIRSEGAPVQVNLSTGYDNVLRDSQVVDMVKDKL